MHKRNSNFINCLKALTVLIVFSLFSSCSDDEKQLLDPSPLKYEVSFQIKGLSEKIITRSNDVTESTISKLLVVAFEENEDNTKTFYKTFSPEEKGGAFSFDMLKEGKFQLYFVANAEAELSKIINAVKSPSELENLIVNQTYQTENGLFLMNSGEQYIFVITKIGEIVKPSTSVVTLKRLVACFEFHNYIDGFIPSKITFNNCVSQSLFINGKNTAAESIKNSGIKTEDILVTGHEKLFSTLYSYENLYPEMSNKISFVVYGTLNNKEVSKEIILQSKEAPENFLVKRNYRYKISLNPGDIDIDVEDIHYKLNFNIEVDEWTDEDIINN